MDIVYGYTGSTANCPPFHLLVHVNLQKDIYRRGNLEITIFIWNATATPTIVCMRYPLLNHGITDCIDA